MDQENFPLLPESLSPIVPETPPNGFGHGIKMRKERNRES